MPEEPLTASRVSSEVRGPGRMVSADGDVSFGALQQGPMSCAVSKDPRSLDPGRHGYVERERYPSNISTALLSFGRWH